MSGFQPKTTKCAKDWNITAQNKEGEVSVNRNHPIHDIAERTVRQAHGVSYHNSVPYVQNAKTVCAAQQCGNYLKVTQ